MAKSHSKPPATEAALAAADVILKNVKFTDDVTVSARRNAQVKLAKTITDSVVEATPVLALKMLEVFLLCTDSQAESGLVAIAKKNPGAAEAAAEEACKAIARNPHAYMAYRALDLLIFYNHALAANEKIIDGILAPLAGNSPVTDGIQSNIGNALARAATTSSAGEEMVARKLGALEIANSGDRPVIRQIEAIRQRVEVALENARVEELSAAVQRIGSGTPPRRAVSTLEA